MPGTSWNLDMVFTESERLPELPDMRTAPAEVCKYCVGLESALSGAFMSISSSCYPVIISSLVADILLQLSSQHGHRNTDLSHHQTV